jgi:type IV pilus assembly protein PilV
MTTSMKCNRGFTLLEVLVAVLVLSIGLLGLAGLQAASLRNNHSGYLRSQATILAYDYIDRMRANRDVALTTNLYETSFDNTADEQVKNCQDSANVCTSEEIAIFDKNQWKCMLGGSDNVPFCSGTLSIAGTLPGGAGDVTRSANGDYLIQVRYQEREGSLNADTTTVQVRARL